MHAYNQHSNYSVLLQLVRHYSLADTASMQSTTASALLLRGCYSYNAAATASGPQRGRYSQQ